MKVISLANQKGGVAKTTTARALADGFARRGKRVLLIDCDPQATLTESCGVRDADVDNPQALRFLGLRKGQEFQVRELGQNQSIITADAGLEIANVELMTRIGRESYLRAAINKIPEELYDYVIIDSNPSMSLLTLNVLAASDYVIIPFKPEACSFKGVDLLLERINEIRAVNPKLDVLGFVVTMADPRRLSTSQAVYELETLAEDKDTLVFNSHIRLAVAAADAPSHGKSIYDYAPGANVAKDYEALSEEILGILEGGYGTW